MIIPSIYINPLGPWSEKHLLNPAEVLHVSLEQALFGFSTLGSAIRIGGSLNSWILGLFLGFARNMPRVS
jgi:hypothetical protein